VPFKERASRTDEALELIRTIWTQEYPEIQTKRYRLQGLKASPIPLQKPRPPILVGGGSEGAFRRVARFGDGWHATATNHDAFRQGQMAVDRYWKEFGRQGTPLWTLRLPILVEGIHQPAVDMRWLRGRYTIQGSVSKVVEQLQGFQALGCSHVALDVTYSAFPAVLETIDILAQEVRPRFGG
jgi:alkanesulfonate monooxygenase SsuD/methylene tetrahydromethanopterin reductase-like flavin-dependent oxidoreductase (luciferase family)